MRVAAVADIADSAHGRIGAFHPDLDVHEASVTSGRPRRIREITDLRESPPQFAGVVE
jgi:hypothetical protein